MFRVYLTYHHLHRAFIPDFYQQKQSISFYRLKKVFVFLFELISFHLVLEFVCIIFVSSPSVTFACLLATNNPNVSAT